MLDNTPRATRSLIFLNVIMFVFTLLNERFMVGAFAMYYPASRSFHLWQVVTHMFMHGGFWHILFNMYTLYIFGAVLERLIGERKFLIFYFACGLGAAALHTGTQWLQAQSFMTQMAEGSQVAAQKAMESYSILKSTPTLGASGAIYGLLIAYAMLFPTNTLTLIFPPISLSAKAWVTIFAVIELFTGITGTVDGVAHFAHLGGMLIGWVLIKYWRKKGTLFPTYW